MTTPNEGGNPYGGRMRPVRGWMPPCPYSWGCGHQFWFQVLVYPVTFSVYVVNFMARVCPCVVLPKRHPIHVSCLHPPYLRLFLHK